MRDELVRAFNLQHVRTTRWNEVWYSDTHVFIINASNDRITIKPRK